MSWYDPLADLFWGEGAAPPPPEKRPKPWWQLPPLSPGTNELFQGLSDVPFAGLFGESYPPPSPPKVTKDDLEDGRRPGAPGAPGEPPPLPPITEFVGPPEEPPYVRYTLPGQRERSYIPDERSDIADTLAAGDWGRREGGFMDVPPNETGGGYGPSQPWDKLPAETRAQFPSYWEGRMQEAGERAADLDELRAAADEARIRKLIEDPMWEEKEKADTWAKAQGKAQFAIWDELNKRRLDDIAKIEKDVLAMDNLSPEQKKQEFEKRVMDNDNLKGYGMFMNTTRLPSVSGFPNLSAGASRGTSPTKPTKRT